jgi:hypothetical protein
VRISQKRRLITWGYLLSSEFILLALSTAERGQSLGLFGWLFFLNPIFTFWFIKIALRIQKAVIPSVTCQNCGTLLDLTSLWKCSCGYTLQKPRHAFDPCKNCGAKMGYFNCPKCDTSIDLL